MADGAGTHGSGNTLPPPSRHRRGSLSRRISPSRSRAPSTPPHQRIRDSVGGVRLQGQVQGQTIEMRYMMKLRDQTRVIASTSGPQGSIRQWQALSRVALQPQDMYGHTQTSCGSSSRSCQYDHRANVRLDPNVSECMVRWCKYFFYLVQYTSECVTKVILCRAMYGKAQRTFSIEAM